MTQLRHLTEEERQGTADGSLDAELLRSTELHLRNCAECAADVDRLRMLMDRVRTSVTHGDPTVVDETWHSIRARIDALKVVPIAPDVAASAEQGRRRVVWVAAAVAAVLVLVAVLPFVRGRANPTDTQRGTNSGLELIEAADSMRAYAAEANELLNQLELQRAMLPPATRASVDRDLRVIDDAIAEVRDALARDPNNPALLRLLASSYRQKIELLKRANGAG